MVLLSFLLVLAAAVTLVIGLLRGGLGLIYVSIGCSVGAGLVLALAVLRSRSRAGAPAAVSPPSPAPSPRAEEPTAVSPVSSSVLRQEPEEEPALLERAGARREPASAVATADPLPIANYDDLKVSEILPLLPELEADELEVVRAHEVDNKNRSRVLGRIEMLQSEREWTVSDAEWEPDTAEEQPGAAPAGLGRAGGLGRGAVLDSGPDLDGFDEEPEEGDFDAFPIADYEDLKVGEIMPLLPELDSDELEMVREREEQGQARAMILNRVNRLLGGAPPAPAAAPVKRTAKKTSRGATATKVPAKKAPARKGTAKRAPAKKAPAKSATKSVRTAKKGTTRSR